jgi:hypothetical protein
MLARSIAAKSTPTPGDDSAVRQPEEKGQIVRQPEEKGQIFALP